MKTKRLLRWAPFCLLAAVVGCSGQSGTSSGGTGGSVAGSGGSAGGHGTGGATGTGGSATGTGGSGIGGASGGPGGMTAGAGGHATGGASATGGAAGGTGGAGTAYHACPTNGTACKIMPFGDSITDGYNSDTQGGYRIELFHDLHTAGKNITFVGSNSNGPSTVDGVPFPQNHEGHSGWTIAPEGGRSGISTLVSTVMPQFKPDVVLLMIGTNDAIDNYDMTNAPTRLGALIDSIYAQLPNVLIVVAQPIPSRGNASLGDDTMLSDRLQTYDGAIPAVAKTRADAGKHILVVDMFTPFNPNKASLLEDQWHPNVQGYALLGDQWFAAIQSAL
ncbi:MAG TPA: SGNH/GDSL hydrolase family protein [Polyangia bacterium]|nr:SGNH/GDSL hydrolase family protein [Polyangia bacterium]